MRPTTYEITAELSGFRTAQRTGVVLQANQNLTVNFSMELGTLAETITVGALGPKGQPVGYSPVGGTMRADKPDVLGYSQFRGSLVNAIDRGTSTACPVVAGVVAAIRTKVDPSVVPPITLRALIRDTAGSHTEGGAWVPGPINTQALLLALGL